MISKKATIRMTAAMLAATTPCMLLAQAPSVTDTELSEARQIPAEQQAAAHIDQNWSAPKTSWGHPDIQGTFSTDDMRGISRNRPEEFGTQEFLTQEQFLERARSQQAGRDRAVNEETFLRNEWGIRTFGFTSLVVDPADGKQPPVNDTGRARAESVQGRGTFGPGPFNKFEDFSLYDRCIALGINRGMGAAIYGNGIRVFQSPNSVSITYEMIHETRIIALDGRPHLEDEIDQFTGNGRGYWDGDTLVIETTGFTDRSSVGGGPNSTQMKTTERLRRVDPEMLEYRVTVDDPDTYTAPFTVRTMWTTQPDYYVYEYSCHEGNGAVGHSLSGERVFERQVAEAIARGEEPPQRTNGRSIYAPPPENADIFSINEGE